MARDAIQAAALARFPEGGVPCPGQPPCAPECLYANFEAGFRQGAAWASREGIATTLGDVQAEQQP